MAEPDPLAAYDYQLPPERIAQEPIEPRDAARLLVAGMHAGDPDHRHVRDLPDLLRPGDLLVCNESRVIPARLLGHKQTGGSVEVLLVHRDETALAEPPTEIWQTMIRGKVRAGTAITFPGESITATVLATHDDGHRQVRFSAPVLPVAERIGRVPLPPYIQREDRPDDRERYQTVFARTPGSVAAPTAGLHLTTDLLDRLAERGVGMAQVDLAVGPGTFKPITSGRIEEHAMHAEYARCPAATVAAIAACRAGGGRVIAVGTTVVRTLESAARANHGTLAPWADWTRLFCYPPQRLTTFDGLLTNFHLPRSTLLLLVACLTGPERLLGLYRAAIDQAYRFFSYGDAMLLLPDPPATAG